MTYYKISCFILFILLKVSLFSQQAETNKSKKNIQEFVDANTNIADYDKINYSELADRKYKFSDVESQTDLSIKRNDLEADKLVPADQRTKDKSESLLQSLKPLDEMQKFPLSISMGDISETDKLDGKRSDNSFLTKSEKNKQNNTESIYSIGIENQEDYKERFDSLKIEVNKPKIDSLIIEKSVVLDTISTIKNSLTLEKDTVLINTVKVDTATIKSVYKSPVGTDIVPKKQQVKSVIPIRVTKEQPKEIIEEKVYPGVQPIVPQTHKENELLEQLLKSGLYEVSEDGKYIRLSRKKTN